VINGEHQYRDLMSWLTATLVHYRDPGACRAALITRDTPPSTTVNLIVFRTPGGAPTMTQVLAVNWAETDPTVEGTWHDHNAPNCPDL
jgi:hypothetical protein